MPNVTMMFGDHATEGRRVYAQTKDRSLSFFADDYGLGFRAELDDEVVATARSLRIAKSSQMRSEAAGRSAARGGTGPRPWDFTGREERR